MMASYPSPPIRSGGSNLEIEQETALGPYRVLDLTDEKGWFCGKILGDLGADVIKIEKPDGDPGRNIGPLYHDVHDPQKSLNWFAFNTSKRGITLDIETADGQEFFSKLVKTVDFIIESFPSGHMEKLGLGYETLSEINPRIIMTSITPFGQTGPRQDYKSCDIVALAMSGMMYLTGDPDRPPLRIQPPQAYLMAGAQAAGGSLIAHHHRQLTGQGQHVDVSIQESLIMATTQAVPFWHLLHIKLLRAGPLRVGLSTKAGARQVWPCKDGMVSFIIQAGKGTQKSNKGLSDWIDSKGFSDDFLRAMNWDKFDMANATQEVHDQLEKPISRFFQAHTKAEIYKGARERGIILSPTNTPGDILEDVQLESRNFWTGIKHPELGATITYPGSFAKMSLTPCGIRRRAPLIGEHNQEIHQELGVAGKNISPMPSQPGLSERQGNRPTQALEGVKIVDFSWVLAGPLITKYLAGHGATVIHIESSKRLDNARTSAPHKPGLPKVNASGLFAFYNSNKYSFTLDLNHPEGIRIAKKLITWGDVVVENFSKGTMEKWGLAYEDLTRINPGIIMLRSTMQGQTGPRAGDRGQGYILIGLSGFTHLTGWPDRGPTPPFGAYTDFIAPTFGVTALIAALDYQRRTGKGQCIDLSQYEAGVHFSAAAILDRAVNGREGDRVGNLCAYAAPHGAYRCRGDDRWCAIAVFSDPEWEAFCEAIDNPEWTKDSRFTTLPGRKQNEIELNRLVEQWTVNLSAEEVMNAMQSRGVAAGVLQTAEDLLNDPQLKHRNSFWWLDHSELGTFPHAGQPFKLSKTPAQARLPSPCQGEHTAMVCKEILGISDEEFVELLNAGVLE